MGRRIATARKANTAPARLVLLKVLVRPETKARLLKQATAQAASLSRFVAHMLGDKPDAA